MSMEHFSPLAEAMLALEAQAALSAAVQAAFEPIGQAAALSPVVLLEAMVAFVVEALVVLQPSTLVVEAFLVPSEEALWLSQAIAAKEARAIKAMTMKATNSTFFTVLLLELKVMLF
jgi:hypothetical protein